MKNGKFERHNNLHRGLGAPPMVHRTVADMNMLSMFLIRFKFPEYKGGSRLVIDGIDRGPWGEYRFPFHSGRHKLRSYIRPKG
jgi:hypothetical protein